MTFDQITYQMSLLEVEITRQQKYIAQFGEQNDADTDSAWEQYKADAAYNLEKWDWMKAQRDVLKGGGE